MIFQNKIKYVIFGNAQSGHLIKWVKALAPLCDLYVISSTSVAEEIFSVINKDKCFSLYHQTNSNGGNIKILKSFFYFKKIIKKINPDIVNAHYITSHGLITSIIKRFFGYKYVQVSSAWGSDILVTPKKNIIYKIITKFILNSSNIITSDAQVMTEQINKLSKTMVLTFAFGIEKLPEISLKEKNYSLFFSNRMLSPNYNIDKVIKHFASIYKLNKQTRLIIANDGEDKVKLMQLCNELNINEVVEFKGFLTQKEQSELYRKSGFYYSLPTSDSTSVSLLEAMAWGCLPIVSDIPANKEWIENEKNGIIISEDNNSFLFDILLKNEEIMKTNRDIIFKKAIFPNLINEYFCNVSQLIDNK